MSIRHLDSLFEPRSVAVFGASDRPDSPGQVLWQNLCDGGFEGPLWPVNPHHRLLGDRPCHAGVGDLPRAPELAVICTPPDSVPGLVAELGERGTRAALVLSTGLSLAQRRAMREAAGRHLLRIVGGGTLGLLAPRHGLNASLARTGALAGELAFVAQSGSITAAMLDWARSRGIGFSHVVSLGEQDDVDLGDLLDWLATEAHTRAILVYAEGVSSARKFMSAARAAARNKPVIIVKAARSAAGLAAAVAAGEAAGGADAVWDAAIARAGMLRVLTLQDLFLAAETLTRLRGTTADAGEAAERLTLLTNGSGAGVLAADAAARGGIDLARLPLATQIALDDLRPPPAHAGAVVTLAGEATPQQCTQALQVLLATPDSGSVLLMHAPTTVAASERVAQELLPVARAHPGRVLGCWLGEGAVQTARQTLRDAGIASFDTPEEAVRAFSMTVNYRRNQVQLMQAPPARAHRGLPQPERVQSLVDDVLAEGREQMTEPEALALLAACGVPVLPAVMVPPDPAAAATAAEMLGYPVRLKRVAPQQPQAQGGVAEDLEDAAAVREAAATLLRRAAQRLPRVRVSGLSVQPQQRASDGLLLAAGSRIDPLFGPVLVLGPGGPDAHLPRAPALPPLNEPLALALLQRTRIARLQRAMPEPAAAMVAGSTQPGALVGLPPYPAGAPEPAEAAVDSAAVVQVMLALSQLLADEPRIAEIDIDTLRVDAHGVQALSAQVRLSAAAPGGAARFAIRPYPAQWVEHLDWRGRRLTLRPIRPEDEAQHVAFLEKLDPADIRMRIFYTRRTIARSELARLTQIDYQREIAFIATAPLAGGGEETLGVVRATCDPDNMDAEFGIVVRSDLKGTGLGRMLMRKLIDTLRAHGTRRVVGTVLAENTAMLELTRKLGFAIEPGEELADTVQVALPLQ